MTNCHSLRQDGVRPNAFQFSRRNAVLAVVGLVLSGCATSVNSLTDAEVGQIRINEVRVTYAADAKIYWEAAEEEFAAVQARTRPVKAADRAREPIVTGSLGNDTMAATMEKAAARSALAQSPEGRTFLQRKVTDKISSRLNGQLKPKFNGSRPVNIEVHVVAFSIPSAGQKIALGGSNIMGAVTTLRDAATGRELAKLDRATGAATGNGWLGTAIEAAIAELPEDRIVANYAEQVETWLLKK